MPPAPWRDKETRKREGKHKRKVVWDEEEHEEEDVVPEPVKKRKVGAKNRFVLAQDPTSLDLFCLCGLNLMR